MPIIGTSADSIDVAEDRERFQQLLQQAEAAAAAQPHRAHRERGARSWPRRSAIRWWCGRATCSAAARWRSCTSRRDLERYMREAVKVSNDSPVLLDRFLNDAIEVDVDCVCDGKRRADRRHHGAHRGGRRALRRLGLLAAAVLARRPSVEDELRRQTVAMAHGAQGRRADERAVRDPGRHGLRAGSESARLAHRAVRLQGHRPAAGQDRGALHGRARRSQQQGVTRRSRCRRTSRSRKRCSRSSSSRASTPSSGPEMKSTGEVMGVGDDLRRGVRQVAARRRRASCPPAGKVFISVRDADKPARGRDRARPGRARLHAASPRAARRRRSTAHGIAGDAGEQGRRRPAAHRRHDQERRDRLHRQHGRGRAHRDVATRARSAARRWRKRVTYYTTLAGAQRGLRRHAAPRRSCEPYVLQELHAKLRLPSHRTLTGNLLSP